ncbi:hypothetical protein D1872_323960 [compost metagenome]
MEVGISRAVDPYGRHSHVFPAVDVLPEGVPHHYSLRWFNPELLQCIEEYLWIWLYLPYVLPCNDDVEVF